jgi:carboxymethylenebutenolidase
MRPLNRKAFAGGLAGLGLLHATQAEAKEALSVEATEGPMALTRFAADVSGKRPCILVLHGSRAIELKPRAYERYAEALEVGNSWQWPGRSAARP